MNLVRVFLHFQVWTLNFDWIPSLGEGESVNKNNMKSIESSVVDINHKFSALKTYLRVNERNNETEKATKRFVVITGDSPLFNMSMVGNAEQRVAVKSFSGSTAEDM